MQNYGVPIVLLLHYLGQYFHYSWFFYIFILSIKKEEDEMYADCQTNTRSIGTSSIQLAILYSLGVMPVTFLKIRLRWCG